MIRVGPYEIRDGVIYRPFHTGTREGVDWNEQWSPGSPDEKLEAVLKGCIALGAEERSKEIGRLLGSVK